MTKWKDLQDTNPEPNLLEAIAHAEKQPVKQYNHAYEVAFSLVSNDPEGKDVTPAMFRAALLQRIKQLDLEKDYGGWEEACGAPFDTYEEDTNPEPNLLEAIAHAENETRAALAVEILDDAMEMHGFDDHVWIQVDREQWEEFCGREQEQPPAP